MLSVLLVVLIKFNLYEFLIGKNENFASILLQMKQCQVLKYGFHKKSFILNATLVSCPFPSSLLGGFAVAPTQK